jgi:biogenesis of lysosome-related organelles complex 1 subunit 2
VDFFGCNFCNLVTDIAAQGVEAPTCFYIKLLFIVVNLHSCTASSEDYRLLLQLNQMTIAKYSDMLAMATRLNDSTKQLNEKYGSLQPYLDQVDMIDTSISALEQTAYQLDAYTKQLEQKFKSLEK